jgi:hypothetical protein
MNTFEDREKAFENKFKYDQELLFRIASRRARLIGLWAAERLGVTGEGAEAYAQDVVSADLDEPGHADIIRNFRLILRLKALKSAITASSASWSSCGRLPDSRWCRSLPPDPEPVLADAAAAGSARTHGRTFALPPPVLPIAGLPIAVAEPEQTRYDSGSRHRRRSQLSGTPGRGGC